MCSHVGPDDSFSGQPNKVATTFLIKKNCVNLNALLFYDDGHLIMDVQPALKRSFKSMLIHYRQDAMLSEGSCG